MAKIKWKMYQSPRSLGSNPVFYGLVLNQSLSAEESLRQIMAEKKITAFQPSQLVTLIDSVLQGAIELTARDGIPRSISSLLRTHLAWDKGFASPDASPKSVPMSVRVRLLKDLRLPVDTAAFEFVQDSALPLPKIERVFSAGTETPSDGIIGTGDIAVQGFNLNGAAAEDGSVQLTHAWVWSDVGEAPGSGTRSEYGFTTPGFYRLNLQRLEGQPTPIDGTAGRLDLEYTITTGTSQNTYVISRDLSVEMGL